MTTNIKSSGFFLDVLTHQDLVGLTPNELGVVWLLQVFCRKDGSVPASTKLLARLCRATEKQMERLLEGVGHLLKPHPEKSDRLIMPMLEEERHVDQQEAKPVAPQKTSAELPKGNPSRQAPRLEVRTSAQPAEKKVNQQRNKASGADDKPKSNSSPPSPPPAPKMSFFRQQETVFDAHDLGLQTLAKLTGQPYHPGDRKKAEHRRRVATAITEVGMDLALLAARNHVLSPYHRGENNSRRKYLEIVHAMDDPQQFANLFKGPDGDLGKALEMSLSKAKDAASMPQLLLTDQAQPKGTSDNPHDKENPK